MEISCSSNIFHQKPGIENRARKNWLRVVDKVRCFSKGITTPGAILMHEEHLLECFELKLNFAGKQIAYRLHPTKSFPKHLIENFQKITDQSIWLYDYLQETLEEKHISGFRHVEYFPEFILSSLTATFGKNCEMIMPNALLALWTELVINAINNKIDPEEKVKVISFKEFVNELTHYGELEPPPPIKLLPLNEYIYILNTQGKLLIVYKVLNIYHSSLAPCEAILSAGKLHIDGQNKITRIIASSGHYRPGIKELINILEHLEKIGMNTDDIEFQFHHSSLKWLKKIYKGSELKLEIQNRKTRLLERLRNISIGAYHLASENTLSGKWNYAKLRKFTKFGIRILSV